MGMIENLVHRDLWAIRRNKNNYFERFKDNSVKSPLSHVYIYRAYVNICI